MLVCPLGCGQAYWEVAYWTVLSNLAVVTVTDDCVILIGVFLVL